jgi:hypothetical protein
MTSPSPAAISVILLGDDGAPFERAADGLAERVQRSGGDLIVLATPDTALGDAARSAIEPAAREHPDAAAFTLALSGLPADPAWRGRRCRSHERNLETLRFASLLAPGALVVRRAALLGALGQSPLPETSDWWRELMRRIAQRGCVLSISADVRRTALLPGEPPTPGFAPPPRAPHVLVFGQIEVSTSLYFDALEASPDVTVAFRALTRLAADAPHLAAADLVVLVRTLHRFWDEGVIAFLEAVGVPWVWFTDDNFQVLAAERDAPAFFTAPRMRQALAGAAAVWASTPVLAEALAPLHGRVEVWGPAQDPVLREAAAPPAADGPLTIAVAGGDFRAGGLAGPVLEELRALAGAAPLRIAATAGIAQALAPRLSAADVVAVPMERSFRQFVRQWRSFGAQLLLHPAGATANAPYKCPTAVITAGYFRAVPVVADEPAYDGWGEAEGVVGIGARGEGLAAAAARARDPAWRADMLGRLDAALVARFGAGGRAERLRALMRSTPAPTDAAALLGTRAFAGQRARLAAARLTRRLRDLVSRPG